MLHARSNLPGPYLSGALAHHLDQILALTKELMLRFDKLCCHAGKVDPVDD
jgi:hypothetical protein